MIVPKPQPSQAFFSLIARLLLSLAIIFVLVIGLENNLYIDEHFLRVTRQELRSFEMAAVFLANFYLLLLQTKVSNGATKRYLLIFCLLFVMSICVFLQTGVNIGGAFPLGTPALEICRFAHRRLSRHSVLI